MATYTQAIERLQAAIDAEDTAEIKRISDAITAANYEIPPEMRPALRTEPVDLPEPEPEPSFLDNWGRTIAEAGGGLTGSVFGVPAGFPGIMAGAALGSQAAGAAWDRLTGTPAPTAQEQVMSAAFNTMGGVTPVPNVGRLAAAGGDEVLSRAIQEAGLPSVTPGQRGSTVGQVVEGWLESSPTAAPSIYRQREGIEGALGRYIEDTYPTQLSRFEAGREAVEGVESVVGTKMPETGGFPAGSLKGRASELYDKLYSLIGSEGRINLEQSKQLLEEHQRRMATDPEYARLINTDPDMSRYLSTLERALAEEAPELVSEAGGVIVDTGGRLMSPPITREVGGTTAEYPLYDTIKQFRTNVGSKIDDPFVTATGGIQGEKRRLYGVLSEDLAQGAEDIGGEAARQARSRADWFNRGLMQRLERINPAFRNTESPEKVYDAMAAMVMRDSDGLEAVKKTLPDQAWEDFSSTYLRRLLSARPGAQNELGDAISYQTMATNLNKLKSEAPESYRLLAGDSIDALDNLQVLANRFRDSERFFNRSRTAAARGLTDIGRLAGDVVVGGGLGALAGGGIGMPAVAGATSLVAGHMIIPWLTSKIITNPSIRQAVAKMPTNLMADVTSPSGLARALVAAGADEVDVQELMEM